MTEQDVHTASRLASEHTKLKYLIARYWNSSGLSLTLSDDDHRTSSAYLGGDIGYQLLIVARAQIEAELRRLGVEPDMSMDGDCFECCGTGRRKLG